MTPDRRARVPTRALLLGAAVVLFLELPSAVWGATGDAQARFGLVLFGLAVLVVAAKIGGLFVEQLGPTR